MAESRYNLQWAAPPGMALFAGKTVWSVPKPFVPWYEKAIYKYSFFPFLFLSFKVVHSRGGDLDHRLIQDSLAHPSTNGISIG